VAGPAVERSLPTATQKPGETCRPATLGNPRMAALRARSCAPSRGVQKIKAHRKALSYDPHNAGSSPTMGRPARRSLCHSPVSPGMSTTVRATPQELPSLRPSRSRGLRRASARRVAAYRGWLGGGWRGGSNRAVHSRSAQALESGLTGAAGPRAACGAGRSVPLIRRDELPQLGPTGPRHAWIAAPAAIPGPGRDHPGSRPPWPGCAGSRPRCTFSAFRERTGRRCWSPPACHLHHRESAP
jgi:hypothetical protein